MLLAPSAVCSSRPSRPRADLLNIENEGIVDVRCCELSPTLFHRMRKGLSKGPPLQLWCAGSPRELADSRAWAGLPFIYA